MQRATQRKYHYIYKTTCQVTGRYYIGMHSTDDLEDGYKGSGKRLWYSIKKYGLDKHICTVLEFLTNREELRIRERELVDEDLLNDSQCMNLKIGGEGGWPNLSAEIRTKAGLAGGFAKLNELSDDSKRKIALGKLLGNKMSSERLSNLWLSDRENQLNLLLTRTGIHAHNENARVKRKETQLRIKFQQGENNSQYGSRWMNDGVNPKRVTKEKIEEYISNGWKFGRKV
jgi:hypothetical protein